MKTILTMTLLILALTLGGCASSSDAASDPDHPGDQPPGERKDGLGIMPGGAGFKQTF